MATKTEEIESVQDAIRATKDELHWTRTAPLPPGEAVLRIGQCVDLIAQEFDALIAQAARPDALPIQTVREWLSPRVEMIILDPSARSHAITPAVKAAPMLAALFGETIKASLTDLVERTHYVAGLPAAERPSRILDLEKQLHTLEIREERLIEAAEAASIEVYRRRDCNPEIVLGWNPDKADGNLPRSALPRGVERVPQIVGAVRATPAGSPAGAFPSV